MAKRIQLSTKASELYRQLLRLHTMVEKAAADAGLDQRLLELVKIRASLLHGCAF
jgi:alkylhydroperoxidase family enzyme